MPGAHRFPLLFVLFLTPVAGLLDSRCSAWQSTAPIKPQAPPDRSLSVRDYIQRGLPDPDRVWSAEDLGRAVKILAEVASKDPGRLPRGGSERSGSVFARLIDPENLLLFKDRTLPLQARMPEALAHFESSNQLNKLYLAAMVKRQVGGREMIELFGSTLRSVAMLFDLVDEFLPTLDKNDPKYQIRMQGLARMKRGFASSLAGTLQCLTEAENYEVKDRIILIGYLKETLPSILPRLGEGARNETVVRLESMAKDPALRDLQPALDELKNLVRKLDREASKVP